ncbi:MAG: adenosine kinase, partial [Pseudomonadota bacterium]
MYDVYGLGNALVDMEYRVDDSFLKQHDIPKGHMTLMDEERLNALTEALSGYTPERMSGGSAANTIIAVQGFGGRTFYS